MMKQMKNLLLLLLALFFVAGCVKNQPADPEPNELPAQAEANGLEQASAPPETPSRPDSSAPDESYDEAPLFDGEPEDREEEWPEEFPVENYRLADGAIAQTGELNRYRYTQLDNAEHYMDMIALYVQQFFGDDLSIEEDSPHDGYANWFIQGENGRASVSGSSITGRFCYTLSPDFDRILKMTEAAIMDEAAMERAAWDFTERFIGITGELELLRTERQESAYHDERSNEIGDVSVPVMVYTFRSKDSSTLALDIHGGLSAPVVTGDSTISDPNIHCFTVTVWPDGTVTEANNYITRADVTPNGSARMLKEEDLPRLLSFFTSFSEHDTVVFDSIRADHFSVYFGSADIEPAMTVEYHFESDPGTSVSTEFVLPGLFDPV